MSIQITCPQCQGTIEAKDEQLGTQARCPHCMQIIKVERGSPASAPPADRAEGNDPDGQPGRGQRPPRKEIKWQEQIGERNGARNLAREAPPPKAAPVAEEPVVKGPVGIVLGSARDHRRKQNVFMILLSSVLRGGNPTDASVVLTGLVAVAVTWLGFFAIIDRLGDENYLRQLLTKRSWVQYATVYFTVWSAIVLLVKFWKVAHQQATLGYNLLPTDQAVKISPDNVDLIVNHIEKFPVNARKNFLINRLLMGLGNFRARKNVPEVGAVLDSQADTDAARVESSYAMLKVLIWAIPIFGFLGTVIGISSAVENFTGAVEKANELDEVKKALGMVTKGLAVAFDTTLLGLILSIVIMFPTNWVQKQEEDLLSMVDHYCDEKLLPRLTTEADAQPGESARKPDPLAGYVGALQEWQQRLEKLETALLEKVVATLGDIRKELADKTVVTDAVLS